MTKKKNNGLRVLSDLAENNLLDQYYNELAVKNKMLLEPSISQEDFNNIILGENKTKSNPKKENKKDNTEESEKEIKKKKEIIIN